MAAPHTPQELLARLDVRHDELLSRLDDLNAQILAALEELATKKPVDKPAGNAGLAIPESGRAVAC